MANKHKLIRINKDRARVLLKNNRLDDARKLYASICKMDKRDAEAWFMLGAVNSRMNKLAPAADCFRKAIAIAPSQPQSHFNLGIVLKNIGKLEESAAALQKTLKFQPENIDAQESLAHVLMELLRMDEAADLFRQVLRFRPQKAGLHFNLGGILQNQGLLEEAAACFREALRLDPVLTGIYGSLGSVLTALGKYDEALDCYREALQHDPSDMQSHSSLLLTLNYLPDQDPDEIFKQHKLWDSAHGYSENILPEYSNDRDPEGRLRVGYVSPDLRTHSVSYFLESLLSHHDRTKVEVFCYSAGARADATTERLKEFSDQWREIGALDDMQVVEMIRHDGIDILLDLSGHTARNRLRVFTFKPAPVQITWLGYPNTSGLSAMDYRLTDVLADPPETKAKYTEKLVYVPDCFLCYQPPAIDIPVAPLAVEKTGYITFGSFNNLAKITPDVIRVWANLLQAIPDAHIFIKNRSLADEATSERYLSMFDEQGISRTRIELLGHTATTEEHLALYARVDIALDTFPYNGTTTTCEALWMGIPVVTLAGKVHAGLVGVSLLSAIGCQEWIADTAEDYIQVAENLASDQEMLAVHRAGLRKRILSSPLCEAKAFAGKMERAYRTMWKQWCIS